jgi:hypothetical protein
VGGVEGIEAGWRTFLWLAGWRVGCTGCRRGGACSRPHLECHGRPTRCLLEDISWQRVARPTAVCRNSFVASSRGSGRQHLALSLLLLLAGHGVHKTAAHDPGPAASSLAPASSLAVNTAPGQPGRLQALGRLARGHWPPSAKGVISKRRIQQPAQPAQPARVVCAVQCSAVQCGAVCLRALLTPVSAGQDQVRPGGLSAEACHARRLLNHRSRGQDG